MPQLNLLSCEGPIRFRVVWFKLAKESDRRIALSLATMAMITLYCRWQFQISDKALPIYIPMFVVSGLFTAATYIALHNSPIDVRRDTVQTLRGIRHLILRLSPAVVLGL